MLWIFDLEYQLLSFLPLVLETVGKIFTYLKIKNMSNKREFSDNIFGIGRQMGTK